MSYSMYDYLAGNRGGMIKRASAPSRNCVNVLRKIAAGNSDDDFNRSVALTNATNFTGNNFVDKEGNWNPDVLMAVKKYIDAEEGEGAADNLFATAQQQSGEGEVAKMRLLQHFMNAVPGSRMSDFERNGVFDPRFVRGMRKAFKTTDAENGTNNSALLPNRGVGEFTEDLLDNYGSHLAYGGTGLGLGALAGALGYKKNRLLGGLVGGAGGAGLGLLTKYLVDQYGGKVGEWIAKKKAERANAAK